MSTRSSASFWTKHGEIGALGARGAARSYAHLTVNPTVGLVRSSSLCSRTTTMNLKTVCRLEAPTTTNLGAGRTTTLMDLPVAAKIMTGQLVLFLFYTEKRVWAGMENDGA